MTLQELGEFGLIERLMLSVTHLLPAGVEGIGDDCAVIPYFNDHSLLITTDTLVENVHFTLDTITPLDLGYKSLAVNLSDIAAMGGEPLYAFLSLSLPPETSLKWIDQYNQGFLQLAKENRTFLLGGDTTRAKELTITVTLVGQIANPYIKRRSQAKPGDFICCTGFLGDSGAGLHLLLHHEMNHPLIEAHVRPRLYLKEGQWLAQQTSVHAMMDISDGIASDLKHIMKASHCGAELNINQLPISADLKQMALKMNGLAEDFALHAGEDYCLLLTIDKEDYARLSQAYEAHFKTPLFLLGTMTEGQKLICFKDGKKLSLTKQGFDHFKILI